MGEVNMQKLNEALESKALGLHYGNRVLLPVSIDILKIIIENDIITDFGPSSRGAQYFKTDSFTEIYFHDYKSLSDVITEYEMIKLIAVESGSDIFDFTLHKKVALRIDKHHKLNMEELPDEFLFIE